MLTPLDFDGHSLHNLIEEDGIGLASVWVANLPIQTAPHASSAAWIFDTGEIWSWQHFQDGKTIRFFEKRMADHLEEYAAVLETLGITRPYRWIAGVSQTKGVQLEPIEIDGRPSRVGRPYECLSNLIELEGELQEGDKGHEALLPFLKKSIAGVRQIGGEIWDCQREINPHKRVSRK